MEGNNSGSPRKAPILARRSRDGKREQALQTHMDHVASAVQAWCGTIGLAATGRIAGLYHDNGKAPDLWQAVKLNSGDKTRLDHAFAGAWMIDKRGTGSRYERLAARMIAIVICGHHAGLPDSVTPSGEDGLSEVFSRHDIAFVESARQRLLDENLEPPSDIGAAGAEAERLMRTIEECTPDGDAALRHFMLGQAARYLASCLINADRLDAMCFEEERDFPPEERRANWRAIRGKLEVWCAEKRKDEGTRLRSKMIARARDVQFSACIKASERAKGGIWQLAGPTGSGKTAAAFRFGIRPLTRGASRMIYVAPYRAILRQTHQTFVDILGGDGDMLLHMSDVVQDDPDHASFAQNWSAPIILTTCVQFLNTLFSGDTRCIRRYHSLAGAVILIDEPQCIPPQLAHHMVRALNMLSRFFGATILLMTATPSIMESLGLDITGRIDAIPDELAPAFDRVRAVDMTSLPLSPDEIARKVSEAERMSTLIVCNTKDTARDVWQAVKARMPDRVVFLLTADLCPAQRNVLLDEIKEHLDRKEDVICVSTQLIQAGVDISFGRGIRALCGLDDLIQTAGRINRYGTSDVQGEIWVVRIEGEDLAGLEDIRIGATLTLNILSDMSCCPGIYGGDILSRAALEAYREKYLNEGGKLLKDANYASHLDLISANAKGTGGWRRKRRQGPPFVLAQAFRTAGEQFHPLDGANDSVIVPWGRGEEIIRELCDEKLSSARRRQLAAEAQAFAVGVYPERLSRLRTRGLIEDRNGMFVAKPEAYDSESGLI